MTDVQAEGGRGPRMDPSNLSQNDQEVFNVMSWNSTGLSEEKLRTAMELKGHCLALQETHLAEIPLTARKMQARHLGCVLKHGKAVPPYAACKRKREDLTKGNDLFTARRNGVAFLLGPGITAKELEMAGSAWKRLWEMQRLYGVFFPPRPGLPSGLRVFTVYAPIWQLIMTADRKEELEEFHENFREFVASLDMSIPTLFCGDWNGTIEPDRDYSEQPADHRVRRCCPLLSYLLGPGGPLVDVVSIFPEARTWTFRGGKSWSRPDTVLVSRSAVRLLVGFRVIEEVSDGGHCPCRLLLRAHTVGST